MLTVGDVTQREGDAGPSKLVFPVRLNRPSAVPVTVRVTVADGSAHVGTDYPSFAPKVVTFKPNVTEAFVSVITYADTTFEGDETLRVNLAQPTNATVLDGVGIGTLREDDVASSPTPVLSVSGSSVYEGDSGSAKLQCSLRLSRPATGTVTATVLVGKSDAAALRRTTRPWRPRCSRLHARPDRQGDLREDQRRLCDRARRSHRTAASRRRPVPRCATPTPSVWCSTTTPQPEGCVDPTWSVTHGPSH